MTITYQSLLEEANQLKSRLNDITTSVYVVFPFDNENYYNSELNVPNFYFLSYFDMDLMDMRFTITDINMNELNVLQEIPADALIEYVGFVSNIRNWQNQMDAPFPYHDFSGKLPEKYAEEIKLSLKEAQGEEGKLV